MRTVVKLGTSTLTNGTLNLSPPLLIELARQISQLQTEGHHVILVSSGAIAAGHERLDFPQLPNRSVPGLFVLRSFFAKINFGQLAMTPNSGAWH